MPPVIFTNLVDGGDSSSSVGSSAKSTPTLDVVGIPISSNTNGLGSLTALGKTYHCQRCLNHGTEIPRKGHKRFCEYANCECLKCSLVEERKILNREINSEREKNATPVNVDKNEEANSKIRARNPKCARCGVHVKDVEPPPLKGHKKICPYQNCTCRKCKLVTRRRSIMAKQIHLRRTQKAKHCNSNNNNNSNSCNSSSSTNGEKSDGNNSATQILSSISTTLSETTIITPSAVSSSSSQIPTSELPTPPNLTSSLCPSTNAPLTLRPSPTYPNMNCCPSAIIGNLTHHHHHHHNIQQQQTCVQNSLTQHLLSSLSQQQAATLPICGHYNSPPTMTAAESGMYLASNQSLGLPMVSANTSANSTSLLFSPSSIISELVLQTTGVMLPPPVTPPHHLHHAHHPPHPHHHHNAAMISSLAAAAAAAGVPLLPLRNDLVTTALERMLAAAAAAPPSSWPNQLSPPTLGYNGSRTMASLPTVLRMPLFANVAEEMHV